jgi:hypothetical protein
MVRYLEIKKTLGYFEKIEIYRIFKQHFETDGTFDVNSDGTINVNGTLKLKSKLSKLPVKFKKVTNDCDFAYNELTSLVGCPQYIGDNFYCSNNKLTTLIGGPQFVGWDYYVGLNPLENLEGISENTSIRGVFSCTWSRTLPLLRSLVALHGVTIIGGRMVETIINDITEGNLRIRVLDARRTLIDSGYRDNAKW